MKKESLGIRFLYKTIIGRIILKILTLRFISKVVGSFLNIRFSKILIKPFVRKNNINLEEYICDFTSFNDFFSRKIKEEYRPIDSKETHLISPCDGYLSAYKIKDGLIIPIKQSYYSISSLLQNKDLEHKYQDGICLVIRLCVNHYHRYCYIDSGVKGKNHYLAGKLHTVRPIALENFPVFTENAREYTLMQTNHFGNVTQIEVGALFVGKIKNHHEEYTFLKGEEKGMFLFGGSTVILLFEPNKISIPNVYFKKTEKEEEIPVKMGEKIGKSK